MKEKVDREQEKESVVSTNQSVSSSCLTSSFQVPNNPCDELLFQYFPDERCFHMIRKGKVEDKIQPQVFKDKESLEIEPRQTGLKVVSSSKELRLYYLFEERRFTLIEKGTAQIDPHSSIHMGEQGDNVRWYPLKEGGLICNPEKFFSSKWPDLRTNRLQYGV
ncbi:hypothetical protein PVK06_002004 [Gossypium arboreum]|uniref:Uncharacterized protein n=1 Tax=Gossypium arboreum TaxID=29729 RepID=A0ABR0R3J2_GOSAR|nr:hypothetical protein PVK06_002004 [Gossypium arboreum]